MLYAFIKEDSFKVNVKVFDNKHIYHVKYKRKIKRKAFYLKDEEEI